MHLDLVVEDARVDTILETIRGAARTDHIGDGKIFVSSIERALRIRTGETDREAL